MEILPAFPLNKYPEIGLCRTTPSPLSDNCKKKRQKNTREKKTTIQTLEKTEMGPCFPILAQCARPTTKKAILPKLPLLLLPDSGVIQLDQRKQIQFMMQKRQR